MLIDLSHTIKDGLITYKGLPAPIVCDYLSREASKAHYSEGTTFHIGKIEMVANTGTYLDAPFHRYENADDISQLDLEKLAAIPALKVEVSESERKIDADVFKDVALKGVAMKGKAVLVQTNWSRHWNTEQYFEGHPFLTEAAARYLKLQGVVLVGIDSLNIDDNSTGERPVHSTLLGADILIVEHLCNLELLPSEAFKFYAVPAKVKGMGTFPVRAFAAIE